MDVQRGRIVAGGRLQVPADMRRMLGLEDGDPVVLRIVDGELHVRPVRDALTRIQTRLRDYLPPDVGAHGGSADDRPGETGHE